MKAGALWPLGLAGVLGVTVLANVWMLYSANDKNAAVVEPDYYQKALAYDSTIAQQQTNADLAWSAELKALPVDADGNARIELQLEDDSGAPITGAAVQVTAIHNLDAARRPLVLLTESGNGAYAGSLELRRPGFWEFRIEAVRGTERFTRSVRKDVGINRGGGP